MFVIFNFEVFLSLKAGDSIIQKTREIFVLNLYWKRSLLQNIREINRNILSTFRFAGRRNAMLWSIRGVYRETPKTVSCETSRFQSHWEQCALLRLNRLTEHYITAGRLWFIARQVCQPTAQYPYPVPSANNGRRPYSLIAASTRSFSPRRPKLLIPISRGDRRRIIRFYGITARRRNCETTRDCIVACTGVSSFTLWNLEFRRHQKWA